MWRKPLQKWTWINLLSDPTPAHRTFCPLQNHKPVSLPDVLFQQQNKEFWVRNPPWSTTTVRTSALGSKSRSNLPLSSLFLPSRWTQNSPHCFYPSVMKRINELLFPDCMKWLVLHYLNTPLLSAQELQLQFFYGPLDAAPLWVEQEPKGLWEEELFSTKTIQIYK